MIGIQIEDEHGELWGEADKRTHLENPNLINWLLSCTDVSNTVCLRFIDPYGDTTFNQAQAKVLLEELAAAQRKISAEAIATEVASKRTRLQKHGISDSQQIWFPSAPELETFTMRLREMIALVIERPHLYIKFVGD